MSDLRSKLIRLAYARPEHRDRLLPLLRKEASSPRARISRTLSIVRRMLGDMVTEVADVAEEHDALNQSSGYTVRFHVRAELCNIGGYFADEIREAGEPARRDKRYNTGTHNSPRDWGIEDRAVSLKLWKLLQKHLIKVAGVVNDASADLMPVLEQEPERNRGAWAAQIEKLFCEMGEEAGDKFKDMAQTWG